MRRPVNTIIIGHPSLLREGVDFAMRRSHYKVNGLADSVDAVSAESWGHSDAPSLIILLSNDSAPQASIDSIVSLRRRRSADCIVVVCSDYGVEQETLLQAGANACVPWTVSPDILVLSLNVLMARDLAMAALTKHDQTTAFEEPAQQLYQAPMPISDRRSTSTQGLTRREIDVLQAVARGESNKHIANRLSMREPTVKSHMRLILRKIGLNNRTQAATWAVENGFFAAPRQFMHVERRSLS